jgi:uncharacterized protein (TIGR00290 family)
MAKAFLSWSSGKDAAFTLLKLLEKGIKPDLLLTTVNIDFQRVSMHGLRIELLEKQAEAVGIELLKIPLSKEVSMETYNNIMSDTLSRLKDKGFTTGFFGDIYLDDLRKFREDQMARIGMKAEFPLWGNDTRDLAVEIIDHDIEAIVVTVNEKYFDQTYVGRDFDRRLLCDMPSDVDWCGENGEFHTFVYNAPYFKFPVAFKTGEKTYREFKPCSKKDKKTFGNKDHQKTWDTGFWYIDLKP